jgi:tetratricopeptide (TPR) repeat protein
MVSALFTRMKYRHSGALLTALGVLVFGLAPSTVHAQSADAQRYVRCVGLVNTQPQQGFEDASAWRAEGGTSPAKHCQALALIALGRHKQAAEVLDGLAQDFLKAERRVGANDILVQSGNAWLLAGDADQAEARLTQALDLTSMQASAVRADILLDRARARFELQNLEGTLADLSQAHALAPKRADVLLLRATAYRVGGLLAQAQADIAAARAIEPNFEPILAEAARIDRLIASAKTDAAIAPPPAR